LKLISCDNCGLVYDQDKITWYDIDLLHTLNENGSNSDNHFQWYDGEYVPCAECICGDKVLKEGD
jgi:hypothetical protein